MPACRHTAFAWLIQWLELGFHVQPRRAHSAATAPVRDPVQHHPATPSAHRPNCLQPINPAPALLIEQPGCSQSKSPHPAISTCCNDGQVVVAPARADRTDLRIRIEGAAPRRCSNPARVRSTDSMHSAISFTPKRRAVATRSRARPRAPSNNGGAAAQRIQRRAHPHDCWTAPARMPINLPITSDASAQNPRLPAFHAQHRHRACRACPVRAAPTIVPRLQCPVLRNTRAATAMVELDGELTDGQSLEYRRDDRRNFGSNRGRQLILADHVDIAGRTAKPPALRPPPRAYTRCIW